MANTFGANICVQKEYGRLSSFPSYRTAFMGIDEQNNENFPRSNGHYNHLNKMRKKQMQHRSAERGKEETRQNREYSIAKE